jgi:hypothetical protein
MTNNEELQLGGRNISSFRLGKIGKRVRVLEGVDKDLNSSAEHQVWSVIVGLSNGNLQIDASQALKIPIMELPSRIVPKSKAVVVEMAEKVNSAVAPVTVCLSGSLE